jgi:predicted HTH transcriptional regulator
MNHRIDLKELAVRESEQVEWKENVADVVDVVRSICAFANDLANLGGGYVVCGARETKDEFGFPTVEMTGLEANRLREVEGRVLQHCRDLVDPDLHPQVEEVPTTNPERRVLVFVVPRSSRAHLFRRGSEAGKYWVRISRETREARNGLLRELLMKKGELEPWDRRPSELATLDDLDLLTLRDAMQRMKIFDPARGVERYLSDQEQFSPFVPPLCARDPLTDDLRPRNFAILLFGREPQRFIRGAFSMFSIYPGEDRSEPHAERHEIPGSLLDQARRLTELLDVQATTAFDKRDPKSPNALKYPQRALHEAMVNALAHRDYESPDPTRLTVFSDRIEIVSPGSLPPGVEEASFRAGRASPKWRNQSLAWFLNRLQLAQAEGQGIPTILRSMKEEGCPPPAFDINADRVVCVLPAHPRHALAREHQGIEQALSLGELTRAQRGILALLDRDPFNFRSVQLFAEIQRALADTGPVAEFVERYRSQLEGFSPLALAHLADALMSAATPEPAHRELASRLLAMASRGHFEEREARRIALSLLRLHQDPEALEFLERMLREHPDWRQNPALLQLRGRTLLQFARRCIRTGQDRLLPPATRGRAWRDSRDYLGRAEQDLREALVHGPEPAVEDYIRKDLDLHSQLLEKARPPQDRRR